MDRRDLEQIDTFLGMVGKASLFDYYGLSSTAGSSEVETAIKKRRGWAQGQQANPKYRNEALWLIKNNSLIRRTMVEDKSAYLAEISDRSLSRNLEVLSLFIKGTLAGGMLTPDAEQAIVKQGRTMGLANESIQERIEHLLEKTGARRQRTEEVADAPTNTSAPFRDFYALLDIPPTATIDEIEAAHRAKYRWARSLKDKARVTDLYADLDEAWRVLKDPQRRTEYDKGHAAHHAGGPVPRAGEEAIGWLPSPGTNPPSDRTRPPKPPPPIRPVPPTFPTRKPPTPTPPPVRTTDLKIGGGATQPGPQRREPPKPPEAVKGRTIGLGGARHSRRSAPRLAIASPEVVALRVGSASVTHTIVVKNTGTGKMPGRITSDRDWLEISRSRLDPDAAQQELNIVVHPRQMRRNRGTALVTVVTDHGERRAITVNVERRSTPAGLIVVGALVVLGAMAAAAWALGVFDGSGDTGDVPSASASLEIRVDPTAESVLVNGEAMGSGERIVLTSDFPVGRPFRLTTQLDGFTTDERSVTVKKDAEEVIIIHLTLEDSLSTAPDPSMTKVKVDLEAFRHQLKTREENIEACFLDGLPHMGGKEAELTADLTVSGKGKLMRFDKTSANFGSEEVETCVRRQLRATQFPLLGGDFGVVEDYTFRVYIPEG